MVETLKKKGKNVRFGIHPVAGEWILIAEYCHLISNLKLSMCSETVMTQLFHSIWAFCIGDSHVWLSCFIMARMGRNMLKAC
jgi:hypothetical protein